MSRGLRVEPEEGGEWMSVRQAARLIGVGEGVIRLAIDRKELRAHKLGGSKGSRGGSVRIHKDDWAKYIDRSSLMPGPSRAPALAADDAAG